MTDENAISESELLARLAVLLSDGIGRHTFMNLITKAGSAQTLLSLGKHEWQHWGLSSQALTSLSNPAWKIAETQLAWQQSSPDHHLIFSDDDRYPKPLTNIPDAPPVLWVRGDYHALHEPQIAIVGSRNATQSGVMTAFDFARDLAKDGLTITSGLAGGIDTASHEGALAHPTGTTTAVIGTGIDLMYPARNKALALKIVEHGAIVSEFPLGTRAQAWHFPQRNRIISGLALGVLVVEATEASGSLITARLALEQGRDVFAIPGSIHNPLSKGCHSLIKRGQAKLTETVGDILFELSGQLQRFLSSDKNISTTPTDVDDIYMTPQAKQLLEYIGFEPILMDDLLIRSGFSPAQTSSLLIELEMSGSVNLYGGGKVARSR